MSIMASIDEEEVHHFNMDDELELLPIDSFDPIDVPLPAPPPAEVQANSRFLSEPTGPSRGPRFSNPTIERMNSFKYRNAPREPSKSSSNTEPTLAPIVDPRSIHQSGYDAVETRQRSAVPATALKKMAATKSSEALLSPKNGSTVPPAPPAPSVIATPPRTVPKAVISPPTSNEAPKVKPQPATEVITTKKPVTPAPQVRSTTPTSLSRPSRLAPPKPAPVVASPVAVVRRVPEPHPVAVATKVPESHPVPAPAPAPIAAPVAPRRQKSAPRERVSIIHRTAPTAELMSPIRARNAAEAAAAATSSSRATTPVLARSLTPTVSKRPRASVGASVDGALAGIRSDSGGWNSNVRVKSKTEIDDAIENITRIKQDSGEKPIEKPRRHTPLRNSGAGSFSQHDLSKVYPRNTDPVVASSAQFFSPTKGTSRSTTPTSRSTVSRSTTPTLNSRPTSRSTTPSNIPQRRRPSLGSYMAGDDASELSGGASLGRSVGRSAGAGGRSPGRQHAPASASLLSPYNLMVSEPNGHTLDSDRLSDADLKTVGNQMLLLKLMLQSKAADDAVKEEEDILRAWQIVHATEEQARSLANHDVGIEEVAKAHQQITDMVSYLLVIYCGVHGTSVLQTVSNYLLQEILVDKVNDHLAPVFERLNAYIYAKNDVADEHHSNGTEDSQENKAQSHRELQARLVTLSKSIAALKRSAESGEYAPPTVNRAHPTTAPVKVHAKAPPKPVYIPTSRPRTVAAETSEPPIKKVPVAKPVSKPSSTLLRPTAASTASNAVPHAAPVTSPVPAKPAGRASLGGRTPVDTTKKEVKVTPKPVAKVATAKATPASTPAGKSVTPKATPGRTSVVPAAPVSATPSHEPPARAVVRPKKTAAAQKSPSPSHRIAAAAVDPGGSFWVNEEVHSYDDSDALGGEHVAQEAAGEHVHSVEQAVCVEQPVMDSLSVSPEIFVHEMEYRHTSESAAAYTESQAVSQELNSSEGQAAEEYSAGADTAVEVEQALEEEALPDFTAEVAEEASENVEEQHPQVLEADAPAEETVEEISEETVPTGCAIAEAAVEELVAVAEQPEPVVDAPTQEVSATAETMESEVLGDSKPPEEPLVQEAHVVESVALANSEVHVASVVPEIAPVQEEVLRVLTETTVPEPAPAPEVPKVVSVDAHLNSMFELQSADSHDAADVAHVNFKGPVLTPEPASEPAMVAVVSAAMTAASAESGDKAAPVEADLKSPERKARGEAFARLMRRMNQNKDDAASASQSGTEPGTPKAATPTVGMFPDIAPAPVEGVAMSAEVSQPALVAPIVAAPVAGKPEPTPSSELQTTVGVPAAMTTAAAATNEMPTSPIDLNTTTSTIYGDILSTTDSAADSNTDLPSPTTEDTQPHSMPKPAPVAAEVAATPVVHAPKSKEVLSVITEDEAPASQSESAGKPAGIRALLSKFEDKKAAATSSFSTGGGQISPSTPGGPGDVGQRLTPKREKSTRLSELMSKFDGAKKESPVPTFTGSQRNVRSSIISIGDITPKKAVFEKDSEAAAEMSSSTESMSKADCAAEPLPTVTEEAVHVTVEPAATPDVVPAIAPSAVPTVPVVVPAVAAKEAELPPAYSEAVQAAVATETEVESTPPLPQPAAVAHQEVLTAVTKEEETFSEMVIVESPSAIEAPTPAAEKVPAHSAVVKDEPPTFVDRVESPSVLPSTLEPEVQAKQEVEAPHSASEQPAVPSDATSAAVADKAAAEVPVPTLSSPAAVPEAVQLAAEPEPEPAATAQLDAHVLPAQSFERLRAASTNSLRDDDTGSNAGSEMSTASKKARRPTLKGLWKRVKSATGMRADDEANASQYNDSPVPDNRPGTSSGPPSVSGLPPSVPRNTVSLNDFFSGTVDNEDEDSGNEGYRYAKEDNNSPFGANGSFGFASSDTSTPMQDETASNASSNQSKTSTKSKDKSKSSLKGLWNMVKSSTKEKP